VNPTTIGLVGIAILVILFFTRMPVAYVMTLVGVGGFAVIVSPDAALNLMARDIVDVFSSYGLTVIPLFILMGQLAFNAGISRKLYDTAHKLVGHTSGGLAMATVCACTAFGAVCGSSAAVAATMATVGLPEMRRYGYGQALAAGTVAAGGSLGMLMPPSVVLIVYGILTEQSIGHLFMAAIIPALVLTFFFLVAVLIYAFIYPEECPRGEAYSWKEKLLSLGDMGETVAVFLLVMGGLFLGWFTPTEAGGVGAFGVLAVSVARRRMTWRALVKSLYETMITSCMTMLLVAGATVFGHFLAITRLPFQIAGWVEHLALPPFAVIAVIVAIFLAGGCFIDALALVMLTIPMFYPIVVNLGYDPIWFGVIIVLVTQMGVITPPVGLNVYVVGGVAQDIPLESIFKGALPYLLALIAGTAFLTAFPGLVVWLPRLMF
jgi:tripartite ATP-independent transporter DctM subunit